MTQSSEYRFALFGRSGSGKTCVLATIEMGVPGNPRGLTCSGIPVQGTKPPGVQKDLNKKDKEAHALHEGATWIQTAVYKLKKEDIPDGNPPDDLERAYQFKLGCEQRGDSVISTVDYAGELLNPDGSMNPDGLAAALQTGLKEYEGFLLIAETPKKDGSDLARLNDELTLLGKTFAGFKESGAMPQTPVAVLLTKWDRYSKVDEKNPEKELRKAEEFLDDERYLAYKSLVNSIRNAVVNQKDIVDSETPPLGLTFGNCAVFPVTAFGQVVQADEVEKPAEERRPFGVLEPFVWMANRRDQLDADSLDRVWSSTRWSILNPIHVSRVRQVAVRLSGRIPYKPDRPSALVSQVWRIRRQAVCILTVVIISWCMIFGLTVASGFGITNRRAFEVQKAIAENPQSSQEQIVAAQRYFNEYRWRWKGWFFAPSSATAEKILTGLYDKLEETYWLPVTKAVDDAERAGAAKNYLDKHKNGLHSAEANRITKAWEASNARTENTAWLDEGQRLSDEARESTKDQRDTKWKTTVEYCESPFPYPEAATTEQQESRYKLIDSSTRELGIALKTIEWDELTKNYEDLLDHGAFKAAAELLVGREVADDQWQTLVREFPDELQKRATERIRKSLEETQFEKARGEAGDAQSAAEALELAIRLNYPELGDLILNWVRNALPKLKDQINLEQDKHLYADVKNLRDLTACKSYLDNDRPRWMTPEVEAFQNHLNALTGPLNLTVSVFVTWDRDYNPSFEKDEDNRIEVYRDDNQVLRKDEVRSNQGHKSGVIGTFQLNEVHVDTTSKFKASIVEVDYFWGLLNSDGGSGTATFNVGELLAGKGTFPLRPTDGGTFSNHLTFEVTKGQPEEPPLPEWKQQ